MAAITRTMLLAMVAVVLSGCLMNWYHPFTSYEVRRNKKQAAEQGDSEALYQMGDSYCCGPKGGYYDTEIAMDYWCRAAKQGHTPSQLAIGRLYENSYKMIGNTIPKNDLKAYMWYSVVASSGNAEAAMLKENLKQYMTPENLARAESMVPHWRETRCTLLKEPEGPWDAEWVRKQEEAAKPKPKDFAKPYPANTKRKSR